MDRQQDHARTTGGAEESSHATRQFPVSSPPDANKSSVTSFRNKLLAAMMLVVLALTVIGFAGLAASHVDIIWLLALPRTGSVRTFADHAERH